MSGQHTRATEVAFESNPRDNTNHEAHELTLYLRPMSKLGEISISKVGGFTKQADNLCSTATRIT